MKSVASVPSYVGPFDLLPWFTELQRRYDVAVRSATTSDTRADLARLGVKLCELRSVLHSEQISERDAQALPRLATWLVARLRAYAPIDAETQAVEAPAHAA